MSKTILITGGSRGIGRAAARLAGARGWRVGVNYVSNPKAASETVTAVEVEGGTAVAVRGDASLEEDVVAMFDATAAALGPIDGVVVNAGIVGPPQQLADMSLDRLERIFRVNVLGAYLCAREAARRLSRERGGRGGAIVLISSAAARLGSPNEYVDYAGSKGAVDTLTLGLAKELGPQGVRVNGIRPGIIDTEIHASGGRPEKPATMGPGAPLGRAGNAEEVGEAIVWLLDDASSYCTGAILDVAGGR